MIQHLATSPSKVLKRQKTVAAPDFPLFIISLYECQCGCGTYSVVITKSDIGYVKDIMNIEYSSSLEAFVKFEKVVEDCMNGKHDMPQPDEGITFD